MTENQHLIMKKVLEGLDSLGYEFTLDEKRSNADQNIFKISHPNWEKDWIYDYFQEVVFYNNTMSCGRKGCRRGIDYETGETHNFGLGNNQQLYDDCISFLSTLKQKQL